MGILTASILSLPIPYIHGIIVDQVFIYKNKSLLMTLLLILFSLYILKYIISIFAKNYLTRIGYTIVNRIRISLIEHSLRIPLSYYDELDKGYVLSRINECDNIAKLFSTTIAEFIISFIQMILYFFILLSINYKIFIAIFLFSPIYFWFVKHSTKLISRMINTQMENFANLSSQMFAILNGVPEIKLFNYYNNTINKVKKRIEIFQRSQVKIIQLSNIFTENILLLYSIQSLIILFISGLLIFNGEITVGNYITFSGYVTGILASLQSLASINLVLKPIFISISRINEFMDIEEEQINCNNKKILSEINSVCFKNVYFRYNENNNFVIKDFNYDIKSGDRIIIQGKNGTGKTTLIKLLVALYCPNQGEILYNGISLTNLNFEVLRSHISIVSQYSYLFEGSLIDNLIMGNNKLEYPEGLKQEILDLDLIHLLDYFDNGLNTYINNGGTNLSGGQRQLVSILRAVISRKDLLIFDEPTSNIDENIKNEVMRIVQKSDLAKIIIIITHDERFDILEDIYKKISLTNVDSENS